MILVCPLCQTRYLIPASHFAAGPRQVRCAKCSHNWQAEAPHTIDVIRAPSPEATESSSENASSPPLPPGSNLPALIKTTWPKWVRYSATAAASVTIIIILLWGIFDRKAIIKDHPYMESFYDSIGLH